MSIAILGSKFHNDDNKVITLDSGALRYIDTITKSYKNEEELKNSDIYREKLKAYSNVYSNDNGKIVLSYIKNNEERLLLSPLYDDPDAIRTRTSSLEEVKSEVEKARKLLLNSKNQMFLTSFLLNKNLSSTTKATVKMTIDEYKIAKSEGLNVTAGDGEYRISINDVLKYRLKHKKLGPMRLLVEDTLEVWKKNMLSLNDEDLYFYSRELRLLLNEYNYRKIPRRVVYNLSINKEYLQERTTIKKHGNFYFNSTIELPKQKVLEERKVS